MNRSDIQRLTPFDEAYPDSLKRISSPPEELYCIGDISLLNKPGLSVVGSRKCSEYGKQVAMKIGKAAVQNGFALVSGMAKGIDSFGHLGALRSGGKTIAVLGCGVDICYPRENRKIYEEIRQTGLLLSQFPPGMEAKPYTFPMRNRIIAALSEATVVVEAGTNSGALITAELAATLGKTVFAVPGNITSACSLGTNKLLTDGAQPIAVIDDIFYQLGVTPQMVPEEIIGLGSDEKLVYDAIKTRGELTVDQLCAILHRDPVFINGIIGILEIKGLIAYSLGKIFIAKW